MARIRTIYNEEALLAGPSPATGVHTTGNIKRINRVQSLGMTSEIPLENVNEYGKLAAIDRVNRGGINSTVQFSYLVTDFENEFNLGFNVNSTQSAVSNFLNKTADDRNYFRVVAPEGTDAEGTPASGVAVLAVGNGFLTSYSFEAAVGAWPTSTVNVAGLNMTSHLDGVAEPLPAVDPTTGRKASGTFTLPTIPAASAGKPSVIQPGDVKVTFSNPSGGIFQTLNQNSININSIGFDFDLNLENIEGLGSRLPKDKTITFPVNINVRMESLFSDLVAANLVDTLCTPQPTDITIDLYNSNCDSSGPALDNIFAKIIIKNAKIDNEDLSGSIGPNDTVTMNFTSQIGAVNDTANGVFFSGVYGYSGITPLYSA